MVGCELNRVFLACDPHCYSRVRLLAIFPISSCSNRCPRVHVSVLSFWTHNMNTLCRLFALLFVRFNVTKTDIPWHHTPKWSVRFMAVGGLLVSVGGRRGKQKFLHIWARCFQPVINDSPRGRTKERWTIPEATFLPTIRHTSWESRMWR